MHDTFQFYLITRCMRQGAGEDVRARHSTREMKRTLRTGWHKPVKRRRERRREPVKRRREQSICLDWELGRLWRFALWRTFFPPAVVYGWCIGNCWRFSPSIRIKISVLRISWRCSKRDKWTPALNKEQQSPVLWNLLLPLVFTSNAHCLTTNFAAQQCDYSKHLILPYRD